MGYRSYYFDYSASTPILPEVSEIIFRVNNEIFGNPSSIHKVGQKARGVIDAARSDISTHFNCSPNEIIFTGSGTESINLAIQGVISANREAGKLPHIITTNIEHSAVLKTCEYLEKCDLAEVTYLKCDEFGQIQPSQVENAIKENTILCTVMFANNEIGTINPIAEIGKICREKKVIFHSDACQATCYSTLNVEELNVDLLSINGAKTYGPKGFGILYKKSDTKITPLFFGGENQEFRLRAGTENTSLIAGFSKALEIAQTQIKEKSEIIRQTELRDYLTNSVLSKIPDSYLNGHPTERLTNNANFSFDGIEGEMLVMRLDEVNICASTGSACTSGSIEPSHVILGIGRSTALAQSSLRISIGRFTTKDEIDYLIENLTTIVADLRSKSPIYLKPQNA